jgi:hypothetical protein
MDEAGRGLINSLSVSGGGGSECWKSIFRCQMKDELYDGTQDKCFHMKGK